MKKKRLIKTITLVLALLLAVWFLQDFVVIPWQPRDVQISGFYKEDRDSLDVVFIGASDMYTAFSPVQAYGEFGFTSYPFAPPRNSVGMWRIQVEEILRTQSPKLIVIEVNGALYTEEDELITEENLRLFTDHIPLSRTKIGLIKSLVPKRDRISYYIPYLKYHGNITSLSEAADTLYERLGFEGRGGLYMKGERTHFNGYSPKGEAWDTVNDDNELPVEPNHEASLRSFLDYCVEYVDCPVLFIRAPHYVNEENEVTVEFFERANRVGNIVADYGFGFINFDKLHRELGLDYETDFYNDEHLNINGQGKFTDYLGAYIAEEYDLKDLRHSDKAEQKWQRGIEYFKEYLRQGEELAENGADAEEYEFFEAESQRLLNRLKNGLN